MVSKALLAGAEEESASEELGVAQEARQDGERKGLKRRPALLGVDEAHRGNAVPFLSSMKQYVYTNRMSALLAKCTRGEMINAWRQALRGPEGRREALPVSLKLSQVWCRVIYRLQE